MTDQDGDDLLRYRADAVIAAMNAWKDLPAAHLKVALKFWNERMAAENALRLVKEKNRNRLDVIGMVAACVISMASVGSAIMFVTVHNYWGAAIMLGPSVFAILKLFVTRKADKVDLKAAGATLGVVSQPGGPTL